MVRRVVGVGDELHRAGVDVAARLHQRHRLRTEAGAQRGRDDGGWALLDDLLVAALERALALAEMDRVAMGVGDHLDLEVAGPREEALDEHAVVAEAGLGLPPGGVEGALSSAERWTTRIPRPLRRPPP